MKGPTRILESLVEIFGWKYICTVQVLREENE